MNFQMRRWFLLCACILGVWSGTDSTYKLQLQSVIFGLPPLTTTTSTITPPTSKTTSVTTTTSSSTPSTTPTLTTTTTTTGCPLPAPTPSPPILDCTKVVYVMFNGKKVTFTCSGDIYAGDDKNKLYLLIDDSNAIISYTDQKKAEAGAVWEVAFTTGNVSGTVAPKYDNSLKSAVGSYNISSTIYQGDVRHMDILSQSSTNKNTQAVVVAVLEGLILLAIIIVFAYRECFAKKKRGLGGGGGGGGGGSASFSANPYGSSGTGVSYGAGNGNGSYYDGAAAAYRRDNDSTSGMPNTMRNDGYGYDQPAMRMEERTSSRDPPAPTQNRVQSETPALVPVPLGSDPLNSWGDQRGGGESRSDDLFR